MIGLTLFFALAAAVWLVIFLHRRATLFHAFEEVAQRYRGRAFTSLGGGPAASFAFRHSSVRLSAKRRLSRNGGRLIRIVLDWPDRRFQLVLLRRGSVIGGFSQSGLSPFRSDQPSLDEQFEIWTNDVEACKLLFSPACVWHLFQLTELAHNRHVFWSVRRGKCQIDLGGHFRKKHQLVEVVGKLLDLYSQAQLTQQHGLDFVSDQTAQVIEEMICPICSGKIGRDVVICVRCRAPHCRDCWHYNGKCATFGCGAEKFTAPVKG